MNKIWLIIKREYLVRVRKKSFIVMTVLGPLLLVSLLILPTYLASESQEKRTIAIADENRELSNKLEDLQAVHRTSQHHPIQTRLFVRITQGEDISPNLFMNNQYF